MAIRKKAKRIKNNVVRKVPPGTSPGTLVVANDAFKPIIALFSYNTEVCIHTDNLSINDAIVQIKNNAHQNYWLKINGIGDKQLLETIGNNFNIHQLEMEDVTNLYQRPKLEEHAAHIFLITRMLHRNVEGNLLNEQISIFCGKNWVITIQDGYDNIFDVIAQRLKSGRGLMRSGGSGYLTYAINDAIVDGYFPLLEKMGDSLDDLEDELLTEATRLSLQKIQDIKRDLIIIRRAAFAERDKVNDMLRGHNDFVTAPVLPYLKDNYDHIIQILDMIDSYKEITASLMDIYISSMSNKLNMVMKVMTVFSAIFMPLTFIVGLYGMNFASEHPITGQPLPLNMPELYSPYGYIGCIAGMLLIIAAEVWYFTRKGWLSI